MTLDIEEGRRRHHLVFTHPTYSVENLTNWLLDNFDALLDAAAKEQKLEALLFAVDKAYREGYALPAFVLQVARSMTPLFDAAITDTPKSSEADDQPQKETGDPGEIKTGVI